MAVSKLFFRKIIPIKTQYKTYNQELLTIVEVFKTYYNDLEAYEYKIFIFTNHNNLCQFIIIKDLSFCLVQ